MCDTYRFEMFGLLDPEPFPPPLTADKREVSRGRYVAVAINVSDR